MVKKLKKSLKSDKKKEKIIADVLKKSVKVSKEDKSELEKELSRDNVNDNFFVESFKSGTAVPVLRRERRAETLDENFPDISGQRVEKRTEGVRRRGC